MSNLIPQVNTFIPTTAFAPVAGIQVYEEMMLRGHLPTYHLLLAHDILAKDRFRRYEVIFQPLLHTALDRTIILDNSVVELKVPITEPSIIMDAAGAVAANVLVLPDVYRDGAATLKSTLDAYPNWVHKSQKTLGYQHKFMVVPQGRTLEEFTRCAEALARGLENTEVGWWGIPRNMVEHIGSRRTCVEICHILQPSWNMHMLGFSDNMVDDFIVAMSYRHIVSGIDSAVPLRVNEFRLSMVPPPRPDGWLETAEYDSRMSDNIAYVNKLLN